MFKLFRNALVASPFGDGTYWYLREDLRWLASGGIEYVVPRGFVTDFASVPRPLWWLFPRWAKYGNAAIVHDFLYWDQKEDRQTADRRIVEGMKDLRVSPVTRKLIYWALRIGGIFAWRANTRTRKSGRKRVITTFPSDPRETWDEYQRRP
jgi:hypothetical protein